MKAITMLKTTGTQDAKTAELFEAADDEQTAATAASTNSADKGAVAVRGISASVAVQVATTQKPGLLPIPGAKIEATQANMDILARRKDAMRVDYNTLARVIANQGNFVMKEGNVALGDSIKFSLMSYQDSFVVSPQDDDAADELVKYSDDGITCSDGTTVADHLAFLKPNYPKAALRKRVVVVGILTKASKNESLAGELIQLDLSPKSAVLWQRYVYRAGVDYIRGVYTEEQLSNVTAETSLQQNGTNTFTQVSFKTDV